MWSARASESSIVIGPTSRRMRPRLSRSRVRSVGSSGSSMASFTTSTARSTQGHRMAVIRVPCNDGTLRGALSARPGAEDLTRDRRFFCSSRRSRAALVGFVGFRRRGTASASRSFSTRRSTASSRLRTGCARPARPPGAPGRRRGRRPGASVPRLAQPTPRCRTAPRLASRTSGRAARPARSTARRAA